MNEQPASDKRLSEVGRLATLLADRVLEAQIMSRPILDVQIRALLDAALVLEEHDMPLPPLLTQILHEVDEASEQGRPDAIQDRSEQGKASGFTRLLRSFRGES
ncbi:hypothetical protein [Methylobacterium soli]|uniref:Uncharacterized protein n=1 Tax=Methylobacterium soli TaxID=553447 RepID=A0A6L3T4Q6_9HYPH|nr:hypothetical protein [Methylobacterium soli]KAB1078246.1 hypothetical protein F6X53_15960 [Methylobacterium soli]GJE45542.1 hypothetical protein AEGHOMDF_4741 [Methylobacterium soli]